LAKRGTIRIDYQNNTRPNLLIDADLSSPRPAAIFARLHRASLPETPRSAA
jgi:hypothetical protein